MSKDVAEQEGVERGKICTNSDGTRFWWKLCARKFCNNHVCLGYDDRLCYTHMPEKQRQLKDKTDGRTG